jgi:hypothetical protein
MKPTLENGRCNLATGLPLSGSPVPWSLDIVGWFPGSGGQHTLKSGAEPGMLMKIQQLSEEL